jgi:hypothetical protein
MADVRLVDLEVIKRYSLAIRQESAPASELLAALDASRATVLAAMTTRRPRTPLATQAAQLPARPTPRAAAAKATAAKKATTGAHKTGAKKTAATRGRTSR